MLISLLANAVLALIIFSLRSTIRIAILELKEFISGKYATKEYVDQQIDVVGRIDNGFASVRSLIAGSSTSTPVVETRPRSVPR